MNDTLIIYTSLVARMDYYGNSAIVRREQIV